MIAHTPLSLCVSLFFSFSPAAHPAFYQQLAKLATFHMRFHFTYYIHIVNRWNMVCFLSSHLLLSGRDRLLLFFFLFSSLFLSLFEMKGKKWLAKYWVPQNILFNKLLLGLNACIIIWVHQFQTDYYYFIIITAICLAKMVIQRKLTSTFMFCNIFSEKLFGW